MFMTRWEPRSVWSEMNRLRDEVERVFSGGERQRFAQSAYPPINLWQDDDQLVVEAELPGFDLEQLDVSVTGDNQLSISGERKQPELNDGTWHRQERGYGEFRRLIELPDPVDAEHVSATFKQGVLTVILPKRQEVKPRSIKVHAS